jgi:hypothetical protein
MMLDVLLLLLLLLQMRPDPAAAATDVEYATEGAARVVSPTV